MNHFRTEWNALVGGDIAVAACAASFVIDFAAISARAPCFDAAFAAGTRIARASALAAKIRMFIIFLLLI
jgi:hypothetical protein